MESTVTTKRLSIDGMRCGACAAKVKKAVLAIDGVSSVNVNVKGKVADIELAHSVPAETLVEAATVGGEYRVREIPVDDPVATTVAAPPAEEGRPESLYPLFLIVGFIALVCLLVAAKSGDFGVMPLMRHFMAGFFLVFSFFKLLDPTGFVTAYQDYDVLARKVPAWGRVYPFVELGLGIVILMEWAPLAANIVTLAIMLLGTVGVAKALLDRKKIRCACLGTALNLPMTKVTLVENLTMAAMAAAMLFFVTR